VVVEVFAAQGQGEHALGLEFIDRVFDRFGIAVVAEASSELPQNAGLRFHLPQEQPAGVRSDGPPIEPTGHRQRAAFLLWGVVRNAG